MEIFQRQRQIIDKVKVRLAQPDSQLSRAAEYSADD
jgi:hypothetical protein